MSVRYDIRELELAIGYGGELGDPDRLTAIKFRTGLSASTIITLRHRGVDYVRADDLACRAGFHPSLIWPTWFADALADETGGAS